MHHATLAPVFDMSPNPVDVLTSFRSKLFACVRDMFPDVANTPAVAEWTCLKHSDGTHVHAQVTLQAPLWLNCFNQNLPLPRKQQKENGLMTPPVSP